MTNAQMKCAAQHWGPWAVEPTWFSKALDAVKRGLWKPGQTQERAVTAERRWPGSEVVSQRDGAGYVMYSWEIVGGVAIIPIVGQMQKGDSSFGGTSTIRVRHAVREAAARQDVRSILLSIDSPGGTVAGTADLAADVRAVSGQKTTFIYIEDFGASAAYWVASQASKVYANATALVGSIGTVLYVEDSSGAADLAGIKVYAIATGNMKAAGAEGTPVTAEQLAYFQKLVKDLQQHFSSGVMRGRRLSGEQLAAVSDGRVFVASEARRLGLIDGIQSLDDTLAQLRGTRQAGGSGPAAGGSRQAAAALKIQRMGLGLTGATPKTGKPRTDAASAALDRMAAGVRRQGKR